MPDVKGCRAAGRKAIGCDGEYVPPEGLCFRHAVLFDVWIAEGGWKVYKHNPDGIAHPTIGKMNSERLRRWKRAQYHKWLDTLSEDDVQRIMESR